MTTVVALRDAARAGAWLASDRQVSGQYSRVSVNAAKWLVGRGCALGCAGDGGLIAAVREAADQLDPRWTAHEVRRFARARFAAVGAVPRVEPGESPYFDFSFVWAAPGRLDNVSASGDVIDCMDGTLAVRGSGADFARGAWFALCRSGVSREEMARTAVEAACRFDLYSGGEPAVTFLPDAAAATVLSAVVAA